LFFQLLVTLKDFYHLFFSDATGGLGMRRITCLLIIVLACFFVEIQAQVDTVWVRKYSGPDSVQSGYTNLMTKDGSGAIYVSGKIHPYDSNPELATVKYLPDGTKAWSTAFNSPGSFDVWGVDIAIDHFGNIFVAAHVDDEFTDVDFLLIKYMPNGDIAWTRTYDGPASGIDWINGVGVDYAGNAYIFGSAEGIDSFMYFVTRKYYPNGDLAWSRLYDGPIHEIMFTADIAVDNDGNSYVAGNGSASGGNTVDEYLIVKYSTNGDTLWTRHYRDPGYQNLYNCPTMVQLDNNGDLIVTGIAQKNYEHTDISTVKYHPDGTLAWGARYPVVQDSFHYVNDMEIDGAGNIFIGAGNNMTSNNQGDYLLLKYFSNGDTAWSRRYDNGGLDDILRGIALDDFGNIYVTGQSDLYNCITVKYGNNGNVLWISAPPPDNYYYGHGDPCGVLADNRGNFYVASTDYAGPAAFETVKYTDHSQGILDQGEPPERFILSLNYPNPFNASTKIEYRLPVASNVKLDIFDILGRRVTTLFDERQEAGIHRVYWDGSGKPSGIYYYVIKAGEYSSTHSMVLLK
jgi:hypothetical protein